MNMFLKFNINEYVRVQLTDFGRKVHRDRFNELREYVCGRSLTACADMKYTPPKEDKNGWSQWQMWVLMDTFGDHIGMAKEHPFETTIEILTNDTLHPTTQIPVPGQ